MPSLGQDLKIKKNSLSEFRDLTSNILDYIKLSVERKIVKGDYILMTSDTAGNKKKIASC